jgi:hypothetical protein
MSLNSKAESLMPAWITVFQKRSPGFLQKQK